jgi:hypothetical protein
MIVRRPTGLSMCIASAEIPHNGFSLQACHSPVAAVVAALPLRHYPAQIEPEET